MNDENMNNKYMDRLVELAEADTLSARLVRDHLQDLADKDTLRLCKKIKIS